MSPSGKRHRRDSDRSGRKREPPLGREKDDPPSGCVEISRSDSEASYLADDSDRIATMTEPLPKALRRETEGRRRFKSHSGQERLLAPLLFALDGYYAVDCIREMRE